MAIHQSAYDKRQRNVALGELGIAPLIVAGGVLKTAKFAKGLFKRSKDPGRFRTNLRLYNQAIAGDVTALAQLKAKTVPGAWGSKKATNDARAKYAAAIAKLAGGTPAVGTVTTKRRTGWGALFPTAQGPMALPEVVTSAGAAPGGAQPSGPMSTAADGTLSVDGASAGGISPLLLAGLGIGAVILLTRKGR